MQSGELAFTTVQFTVTSTILKCQKSQEVKNQELSKETSSHFKPEVDSIGPGSKLLMDSLEQSKTKDVARDVAMAHTNDLVEVAC